MSENKHTGPDLQVMVMEWLNAAGRFWGQAGREDSGSASESGQAERFSRDTYAAMMGTFHAVSSALSEPLAMDSLLRTTTVLPDITTTLLVTGMKGYFALQQQIINKIEKIGNSTDSYRFDSIDQEILRAWSEIYQNEIRQYFNIPQLGLSRFYQERVNQALDKLNIFSTSLAEFLQLLSLPFEKSFLMMQEKIDKLTRSGNLPEDSRAYYQMWVRILEGHFMTLFQSPEYNKALGETMNALEDYLAARSRILQDMLQSLPVPSRKEMEDLCKEVYLLKKKIRSLEKTNSEK
jgi:class III poly(R)-hydroxyalkanoic acid synthase PhaE subunit